MGPVWLRFVEGEEGGAVSAPAEGDAETAPAEDTDTTAVEDSTTDAEASGEESGAVDWEAKYKAAIEHSRTWEERAKSNKAAADKLKELEDGVKTETDTLRSELAEARREATRFKVASAHGLSAEDAALFLTADGEEAMEAQAKRLIELSEKKKPKRTVEVPDESRDRTPPAPSLNTGHELWNRLKSTL